MRIEADPAARSAIRLTMAVFLVEVLVLLLRSALQMRLAADGMTETVAPELSYLIVPPALLLLLLPVAPALWRATRDLFRDDRLRLRTALLALALGLSVRLFYWGTLIASVAFGWHENGDPRAVAGPLMDWQCPSPDTLLLRLLVTVVIIPVVEEGIHRGWFLHWLLAVGRGPAIVVSALLFALLHTPATMPYAFIFGVLLSILRFNAASLWVTIIAHATANALVLLDWHCLHVTWNPSTPGHAEVAVGALAAALAACALGLSMLLVSRRVTGHVADDPPPGD